MEFLKDYLTEETYAKVAEELQDNKEVKLANLKSGEYVSKDKYGALESKVADLETQLSSKSTAYDELLNKVGDNDALKAEIENLKNSSQTELETTRNTYETKLRDAEIKSVLIKEKVKDVKDIIGQLDLTNVRIEDDVLKGLDDQLATLKENKPYLFEDEKTKGKTGLDHGNESNGVDGNAIRAVLGLPTNN